MLNKLNSKYQQYWWRKPLGCQLQAVTGWYVRVRILLMTHRDIAAAGCGNGLGNEGFSVEEMYGRGAKRMDPPPPPPQKGAKVIIMPVRPDFESSEYTQLTLRTFVQYLFIFCNFFIKANSKLSGILYFFLNIFWKRWKCKATVNPFFEN